MKRLAILVLFGISCLRLDAERPKIGLVLSGGGAKGLAHIGVLQAIDSAGLKIDYITGTSMGSIMGALYAVGYSGDTIEEIARNIHWAELLSNKFALRQVGIEEKMEYGQYSIELPVDTKGVKIASGIIESESLWLKFSDLFYPVYPVKDFSRFSIPFKCNATDVATGKVVMHDSGEVVTAIRSSMAIPSVFTPVEWKNMKLVDGGVVHNFPVSDIKKMGADIIIGVNVGAPLMKKDELNTALDILYQVSMYKDADDFIKQKALCTIFIEPDLTGFSAGSFGASDTIIAIGKALGNTFYPAFRQLADSLNAIYGQQEFKRDRLPKTGPVQLTEIKINGLVHTTYHFCYGKLGLNEGRTYTSRDFKQAMRQLFGTRMYNRVVYRLEPVGPDKARLLVDVEETPLNFVKAGFHYNTFSDVAFILGFSGRNILFDRSKLDIKMNVSENYRFRGSYTLMLDSKNKYAVRLGAYTDGVQYPIYSEYISNLLFRRFYSNISLQLEHYISQSTILAIGGGWEKFRLRPKIYSLFTLDANNRAYNAYVSLRTITLDRWFFPNNGWDVSAVSDFVFGQKPDARFQIIGSESVDIPIDPADVDPFIRLAATATRYSAINDKWVWSARVNAGLSCWYRPIYQDPFLVGGMVKQYRNQFDFVGLPEYTINNSSVAVAQAGIRRQLFSDAYLTGKANVGLSEFIVYDSFTWEDSQFNSGYSLTFGYSTPVGPLEISAMYSDQSQKVLGYVNLGIQF